MTNTRDKLNESKYFLEGMKRISSEPDKFRYELTAFLAACRSITYIMQKEFSGESNFADWYAQRQEEMKRNPILKYLHRQRAITHHERPVLSYPIRVTDQSSDRGYITAILTGTASTLSLSHGSIPFSDIQPRSVIKYYFDDIKEKDRDVLTICQEAMVALEKIVDDCEERFVVNKEG